MNTCTEHIIVLGFKLQMLVIYIDGPAIMLNYNESAVNNSSKIESTLNKKHISIAYHLVCHNVSSGVVKIGWISTADNIADALTKILRETKRKSYLVVGLIGVTNCLADRLGQLNTDVIQQL